MGWAFLTLAFVAFGVTYLLLTVGAIQRAKDEVAHYRLSVRFWATLAVLGVVLVVMFVHPVLTYEWLYSSTGRLTVMLMSILPAVVIFAGVRNAMSLWFAQRRRGPALREGVVVRAKVIDRGRRLLGQDLMSVVVEANIPVDLPRAELRYRQRDPNPSEIRRFVETCPGDHWNRFEPGTTVSLKYLPADPSSFALLLFERAA